MILDSIIVREEEHDAIIKEPEQIQKNVSNVSLAGSEISPTTSPTISVTTLDNETILDNETSEDNDYVNDDEKIKKSRTKGRKSTF